MAVSKIRWTSAPTSGVLAVPSGICLVGEAIHPANLAGSCALLNSDGSRRPGLVLAYGTFGLICVTAGVGLMMEKWVAARLFPRQGRMPTSSTWPLTSARQATCLQALHQAGLRGLPVRGSASSPARRKRPAATRSSAACLGAGGRDRCGGSPDHRDISVNYICQPAFPSTPA